MLERCWAASATPSLPQRTPRRVRRGLPSPTTDRLRDESTKTRTGMALVEAAGAEVVYLELPLAEAGTPELCVACEAMGFFFSGVAPCFAADGDALRLQYLSVLLDPGRLQVASRFGQELVDYAATRRARVEASSARP